MIVSLSEPDGFYSDENYVSNELDLERVLPDLERTFERGRVYVGVGPEQNFSYVAALRPRIAFIVDIRRQNAMELLLYKALFELADDRADFLSLLFSRPKLSDAHSDHSIAAYSDVAADLALFDTTLASIFDVLVERHGFALDAPDRASITKVFTAFLTEGPRIRYIFRNSLEWHPSYVEVMDMTDASGTNWSYLGSEERFQRVKRMQIENRIVPVVGDFAGPKALRAIGNYVRGIGSSIDVFYVSNVEQYLFNDNTWEPFYDNVATLPIGDDAIFIRTVFGARPAECGRPELPVRAPLVGSISKLLADFRNGGVTTRCSLLERSR